MCKTLVIVFDLSLILFLNLPEKLILSFKPLILCIDITSCKSQNVIRDLMLGHYTPKRPSDFFVRRMAEINRDLNQKEGENIPNQWVDMIANGDITDAQTLQSKYVHKIGNLTLSGYNANLGNKSFKEKRDRTDQQKRPIGYKNGLYLNRELAGMDDWSVEKITMRTDQLVQEILDFYSFETEKVQKAA